GGHTSSDSAGETAQVNGLSSSCLSDDGGRGADASVGSPRWVRNLRMTTGMVAPTRMRPPHLARHGFRQAAAPPDPRKTGSPRGAGPLASGSLAHPTPGATPPRSAPVNQEVRGMLVGPGRNLLGGRP